MAKEPLGVTTIPLHLIIFNQVENLIFEEMEQKILSLVVEIESLVCIFRRYHITLS